MNAPESMFVHAMRVYDILHHLKFEKVFLCGTQVYVLVIYFSSLIIMSWIILDKVGLNCLKLTLEAEVPWSPYAKVSLDSLMTLLVHDSKVPIEYARNGEIFQGTIMFVSPPLISNNFRFEDPNNRGYPLLPVAILALVVDLNR